MTVCQGLGRFPAARQRLQAFYPEDVRVKKIAARAAVMAQAGQYNYPRCQKRGDPVAAQLALSEFMRAAMSMTYLLNRRYAPFYKWMHRGLQDMERLPGISARLEQLSRTAPALDTVEQIEGICLDVIGELKRQGLTDRGDPFLLDHCGEMMGRIRDPALRRSHIMEE